MGYTSAIVTYCNNIIDLYDIISPPMIADDWPPRIISRPGLPLWKPWGSMVFNVGNTLAAIDNYHLGMVYSTHEKNNDFGDGLSLGLPQHMSFPSHLFSKWNLELPKTFKTVLTGKIRHELESLWDNHIWRVHNLKAVSSSLYPLDVEQEKRQNTVDVHVGNSSPNMQMPSGSQTWLAGKFLIDFKLPFI